MKNATKNKKAVAVKCVGPGCEKDAIEGSKYCSTRCRLNYNAQQSRRRKGVLSREDSIAALEPRTCPQCNTEFTPASPKQVYCTEECRGAAANEKRRTAERPFDSRENTLTMLDYATVYPAVTNSSYDWQLFRWLSKDEYYKTDERHAETKAIIVEAQQFLAQEGEMSMRFLFYHLVQVGLLKNEQAQYQELARKISEARDRGDIPTNAFTDNVRESITYQSWSTPDEFKASVASAYKIDLWQNQSTIIEVWTEKDSVVSALEPVVREYRVPLRVLRGQGSNSYLDTVARDLRSVEKPLRILYLGDHDPAGYVIEKSARQRFYALLMEEFGWDAARVAGQIQWKRIGFLHEDFEEHDIEALPENDKKFAKEEFLELFPDGHMAELEGLTPDELRRRTRAGIEEIMGETGLAQRAVDLEREEKERSALMAE